MPAQQSNTNGAVPRWFPTTQQLGDPAKLEVAFRQLLTMFYASQDRIARLEGHTPAAASAPAASGPTTTKIAGLFVAPIDTSTLADGATLKYDKAAGNLKFG